MAASQEDDPIVQEIPIMLSKRLSNQMYVFQYPLQPKNKCLDLKHIKKCSFKPRNQEVKIELGINIHSNNFDTVKAEYIAEEVDKKEKKDKIFDKEIVDKVIYNSSKVLKEPGKYAVGVYNGKEFHLIPLKGFLQLRPNFSYMDKTFLNSKRKRGDTESDEEEETNEEAVAQQKITVKFARNETEQMKKARENSFKMLQEKSALEPWIECSWKPLKSTESEVLKHKLFAESTMDIDQAKDIEGESYVRLLIPEDREEALVNKTNQQINQQT